MSEQKKIENPALVWAIEQLRIQNTKEAQKQLFTEIVKAVFIVPATITPVGEPTAPDENGQRKQQMQVRLRMITSKNDQSKVIPLFTDDDQKAKGEKEGEPKPQYVPLRLTDVARVIAADPQLAGVVINPYGAVNVRLTREQVIALLGQPKAAAQQPAQAQQKQPGVQQVQVKIGTPTEIPTDLLQRLTVELEKDPRITRAWLRFLEKEDEKGYLCVVEGQGVNFQALFPRLAESAKPYPSGLRFFAAQYQGDFGVKATKDALPFFERGVQVM
ncbi:MAG: enhanced serine sensitivity protein SseB C-terminal domain-containing protein [Butyricicoccus sp.]|nr:enhanced serine sensitivity protein SseB C-terminal domain-containing protein [Butyricicoccus sp.]